MRLKQIKIVVSILALVLIISVPTSVWADELPLQTEPITEETKPGATESAPWSQYLGEPPAAAPNPSPKTPATKPPAKPNLTPTVDFKPNNVLAEAENKIQPDEDNGIDQTITDKNTSTNHIAKLASLFALILALATVLGLTYFFKKNH